MSQTPIYDQLRGERINADVPTAGADPQPVGHSGHHRIPADAPNAATVFGRPPGRGADLATNQHHHAVVEQVVIAGKARRT